MPNRSTVIQFGVMHKFGVYVMLTLCGLFTVAVAIWLMVSLSQVQAIDLTETIVIELANGQGQVRGNYDVTSWTEQKFMQFRGIPFAEAPVGKMRFRPPVARSSWSPNIHDALNFGQRCPVITNLDGLKSDAELEDCLNLCVYTKNLKSRQPVMFYVYGGGYYNGSAEDHPANYFLEKDIVLVVPQYRVGALGWLSTYTEGLPGNAPMSDILLALEWVQEHIHVFGGDAEQVTIFGQSAGSAVTSGLVLSPRVSERLFQRAIVQSGSIFAGWAINKNPVGQAQRICQKLGCSHCVMPDQLLHCLQEAKVRDILESTKSESFSPIVGDLQGILPQQANELIKSYKREVPLLTGFTQHDGSFVLASYYDALASKMSNLSSLSVRQFSQGLIDMVNDTTGLTDQLMYRLLFPKHILQGHDHRKALPAYFDLTSVAFMKSPVISLAQKLHTYQPSVPVYVYSFEYEGQHTRFGYEFGNSHYPFNGGVHHSNDNIYLFATHHLEAEDKQMAQQMIEIWTSFAINGIPKDMKPLSSTEGPYNRINLKINIDENLLDSFTATIDDPDNERLQRDRVEF